MGYVVIPRLLKSSRQTQPASGPRCPVFSDSLEILTTYKLSVLDSHRLYSVQSFFISVQWSATTMIISISVSFCLILKSLIFSLDHSVSFPRIGHFTFSIKSSDLGTNAKSSVCIIHDRWRRFYLFVTICWSLSCILCEDCWHLILLPPFSNSLI